MTFKEITTMLKEIELPFAYDHFAEGESPDPPFLVYLMQSADNFAADGIAYFIVNNLHLELYTDIKDPELEEKIESVLTKYGLFYSKSEVWISSEKLYEVLYQLEV